MREPLTLAGVLTDMLKRVEGCAPHWDRRGNLIRLRSRTWPLDRPREIPLRVVCRWKALCDRQGVPRLDQYVQIVTALTDDQLGSINHLGQEAGFPPTMFDLYAARYALRLYGSLTPAQWQILWREAVLPAAQMTPSQRALLSAHAREPQPFYPLWMMTPPRPPDGLALKASNPSILRRERHGGITLPYSEEDHPLPKANATRPAAPVPKAENATPEESVTRFRIRTISLWAVSGSEKRAEVTLDVPAEP